MNGVPESPATEGSNRSETFRDMLEVGLCKGPLHDLENLVRKVPGAATPAQVA